MTVTLTPELRAYFRRLDRSVLMVDLVRDLVRDFGLTPEQAGQAIVAAVMEDLPSTPAALDCRTPQYLDHP